MNQDDALTASSSPVKEELRTLSKESLAETIKLHGLWLESGGKQGQCADLRKTNLRGASLVGFNLEKSNLEEAYLYGAYLKKANLQAANLSGSNLRGANLRWADLRGAVLTGANLTRVDLMKADLRGANLEKVLHLDCEQLSSAVVNRETRFPSCLEIVWTGDDSFECKKVTGGN